MAQPLRGIALLCALLAPGSLVVAVNCGGSDDNQTSGSGAGNAGAASVANAGGQSTNSSGVGPVPTAQAPCGGKLYDCGDLQDNDNDGLIDSQDPDCLGPCDNTEDSYYPDLPGLTGDPCRVDCFWDQGNGPSDDCHWDHKCDPLSVAPDYPPEGQDCEYDPNAGAGPLTCTEALMSQSTECVDFCGPLAPNGCDCFGCCELPAGSGLFVWLGSADDNKNGTCTIDVVDDTSLCKPCTPVPGCNNDCDPCELCIGKTELPPECGEGGGPPTQECPPEFPPCGLPGQDPCPADSYCTTGCCVPLPQ